MHQIVEQRILLHLFKITILHVCVKKLAVNVVKSEIVVVVSLKSVRFEVYDHWSFDVANCSLSLVICEVCKNHFEAAFTHHIQNFERLFCTVND
jgi:hypothetical protein